MTRRLRILDLFSCAGGAAMGYHRAGFEVVGVDIDPQPRYPFEHHVADAIEFALAHGHEFDAIHASPPCQSYSTLNAYNKKTYPDLIEPVRTLLVGTGRPWVMENVPQAPLRDPVVLCGQMFGLRVYRHRGFESGGGLTLPQPEHARHVALCARNGYLPSSDRPFMTISGGAHSRAWQLAACDALGTPWMRVPVSGNVKLGIREVCESIPPAYTEWIGARLAAALTVGAVAA
jgi:DNA (cytosine-5)-methyltransferase 1